MSVGYAVTQSFEAPVISGLTFVRPLGAGGFSEVGLYERDFPRQLVAVKVLKKKVSNARHAEAFQREANALALLASHPSIVTIYDAGVSADGRPYLVMQYFPRTLGTAFRSCPLKIPELLDLGVRLACALETCHRAGILHRDIKPSNVLVSEYGTPVLSDFGIVAQVRGADTADYFAMSLPWSAPEVVREHSTGSVAAEIWSLSATLYALVAGRGPFESGGVEQNDVAKVRARILRARYIPVRRADMVHQLNQVLEQGLSKHPHQRQSSSLEFARQLRGVQRDLGLGVTALEIPAEATTWSPSAKQPDAMAGPVRPEVALQSQRRRLRERQARSLREAPMLEKEWVRRAIGK